MPTYAYRCKACGHEFEELQSMSAAPLLKCPKCGKRKLVRLISGAGLVFKGTGFYLTDYTKRGSSTSESSQDKTEGSGPSTGDDSSASGSGEKKDASKPAPPQKKGKGGSTQSGGSGSKK